MIPGRLRLAALLPVLTVATACGLSTDPATRLALDIESGADSLGQAGGARFAVAHRTPSRSGQCEGPYTVQLDEVGAIIVWCRDGAGNTVSSHSTSYHGRFVDTPRTYYLEKPPAARSPSSSSAAAAAPWWRTSADPRRSVGGNGGEHHPPSSGPQGNADPAVHARFPPQQRVRLAGSRP